MTFFSIFPVIAALLGGGGHLLDFVDSEEYWRIKEVQISGQRMLQEIRPAAAVDLGDAIHRLGDPEPAVRQAAVQQIRAAGEGAIPALQQASESDQPAIAAAARQLLAQIRADAHSAQVRRLMAIRTLGEMRHEPAVEALRPLSASADPFTAYYARRALLAIRGEPAPPVFEPAAKAARLSADLSLLPAGAAVVGQMGMLQPATRPDEFLRLFGGQPQEARRQITEALLPIVEQIGDVRIDSVTFAVAEDVGPMSGWVVVIVSGQWDREAALQYVESELADGHEAAPPVRRDVQGVPIIALDDNAHLMVPSAQRLLFMAGPTGLQLPTQQMLAAIRDGRGTLQQNQPLVELIEEVDMTLPLWTAMRVPRAMRQLPTFAPLRSITITGTIDEAGAMQLAGRAVGDADDEQAIARAAADIQQQVVNARQEMARIPEDHIPPEMLPQLRMMRRFLESVQIEHEQGEIRARATVDSFVGLAGMWLGAVGVQSAEEEIDPPPQPRPAP